MKQAVLSFLLALIPILIWADDNGECGDGVTYKYIEATQTLIITKSGEGSGTMKDCDGGAPWKSYRENIREVKIEDGVTTIGRWAFCRCKNLTTVTIPNSVVSVFDYAFDNCSNLKSMVFPNSITYVGSSIFDECPWVENQPDGLIYIGKIAYKYKGTMPHNSKIEIKEGTLEIYESAFSECSGLTSLLLPESLTSIGNCAFYGCSILSSLIIPTNVKHIGISAFYDCKSLSNISIPDNVTSIGQTAFYNTPWYNNQPEGLIYIGKVAYQYKGIAGNTNVVIKDGTVSITPHAFYGSGVKSVNLPNSMKSVSQYAFTGCNNLSSINIPTSVTAIDICAFSGCSSLSSITIPNSVTSLGYSAFSGCESLTSVTIPSSVEFMGSGVFDNCSSLSLVTILSPFLNRPKYDYNDFPFNYNAQGRIIYVPAGSIDFYKSMWYKYSSSIYYLGEKNGSCGDDVNYSFEESTGLLIISGEGPMATFNYYNQKPWMSFASSIKQLIIESGVTSVSDNAFQGCTNLSSVTIPRSVNYVGEGAFSGTAWYDNQSDGLIYAGKVAYNYKGTMPDNTKVDITDGTLSISGSAFRYCNGLVSVTIPNSVISIGSSSFEGCSNLTSINIPNKVTSIEQFTFNNCSGLKSVSIPNDVSNIGMYSFQGCSSLSSVTIPNGVTILEEYVFANCSGLTSVNIPASVVSIKRGAFSGCCSLTSMVIPNNVTYIDTSVLSGCSNLTSITIPNSVTAISGEAFRGCSSLTSIIIPNNVSSIGSSVFEGCSSLSSVSLPNNVNFIGMSAFAGCSSLATITIPNKVTDINIATFSGCSALTSVIIPDGVLSIRNNAFQDCCSLTSITIPSSINSIGEYVFMGCSNLNAIVVDKENTVYDSRVDCNAIINTNTNVLLYGCNSTLIPAGIVSISSRAFDGCSALTSIIIPASVSSILDDSFYECNSLEFISVDKANTKYDSRDNCNAIIETATNRLILAGISASIPDGVSLASMNAYKNCVSLSLPDGLETISSNMFEGCLKLESIRIPGSVKTIDSGAFRNCTSLKNVIFEEGADPLIFKAYSYYYMNWFENCPLENITIGRNIEYNISYTSSLYNSMSPFRDKETLTEVVFSGKVSSIPNGMFRGCRNLAVAQLPERMDIIGSSAFYDCENLVTISLPEGIKDIGNSTFFNCKKIPSFTIPNSVETIGESAFYGCETIPAITIPNSVTNIARGAFLNCINLSILSIEEGEEPLTIRDEGYNYAFSGCPISSMYVGRDIVNDSYNYIYSSLAYFTTPFDLTIGKKVKTLSGGTFANCEKIKTLTFEDGEDILTFVKDHNAYSSIMPFANTSIETLYMGRVVVGTDNYYPDNTTIPFANVGSSFTMRVGDNITEIGEGAYAGWMVSSLIIPKNVLKIGVDAIGNCAHLTSVAIEDGTTPLEFMEGTGFQGCQLKELYVGRNLKYDSWKSPFRYNKEALSSLTIGDQVTEISENEFVGLKSLKTLELPTSLKKIGYQAFYGCEALTTVIIPNSITEIDEDAFGLTRGLTSFTIEDGTESLSINNNFLNSPLGEVYVGRNITYPEGNSPFSMLESIKKVTIGSHVSRLEDTQFAGCQNLKDVVSHALSVPSTGQHVFTEAYQAEATLHVPESAYNKYQNTYPWYLFKNFQLIDENGTETPKTIVLGDASGNGIVNTDDIDEIVRYIMGNPSESFNFGNADMNKDGKVNAADIVILIKIMPL